MKRMWTTAAAALALTLAVVGAADALSRGKPGTQTRKDYCQAKYDACVDNANKDCKVTSPIAYDSSVCLQGALLSCQRSWGDKSTCNSEPLAGGAATTGIVKPKSNAQSP